MFLWHTTCHPPTNPLPIETKPLPLHAAPLSTPMWLCWLVKQHSVLVLFLFAMFFSQVLAIRYRQKRKITNLSLVIGGCLKLSPSRLHTLAISLALWGALWLALRYFCQSNGLRWHLAKKRQSRLQKLLAFGPTPTLPSLSTPHRTLSFYDCRSACCDVLLQIIC